MEKKPAVPDVSGALLVKELARVFGITIGALLFAVIIMGALSQASASELKVIIGAMTAIIMWFLLYRITA